MARVLGVWAKFQRRGLDEGQAISWGVVRTVGRGQILGGVARVCGQGLRNSVPKGGGKSVLSAPSCGYPGVRPPLFKNSFIKYNVYSLHFNYLKCTTQWF